MSVDYQRHYVHDSSVNANNEMRTQAGVVLGFMAWDINKN